MVARVGDDDLLAEDDAAVREEELALVLAVAAEGAPVLQARRVVHRHAVVLAVTHEELAAAHREALREGERRLGRALFGYRRSGRLRALWGQATHTLE